jgi:hypothetical protein
MTPAMAMTIDSSENRIFNILVSLVSKVRVGLTIIGSGKRKYLSDGLFSPESRRSSQTVNQRTNGAAWPQDGRTRSRFSRQVAKPQRRVGKHFQPVEVFCTNRRAYSILILSLRLPYALASTLGQVRKMQTQGELRIDPGQLGPDAFNGELELVVPYTDPDLTRALLRKAAALTAGLQARIALVAVHSVPFPADFRCSASAHAFLVDRLTELAAGCPLPVNPQVVLARSRQEGFRYVLHPESTVLVGSHRRFWRTSEERLARTLASDGHKVALLHLEKEKTNA